MFINGFRPYTPIKPQSPNRDNTVKNHTPAQTQPQFKSQLYPQAHPHFYRTSFKGDPNKDNLNVFKTFERGDFDSMKNAHDRAVVAAVQNSKPIKAFLDQFNPSILYFHKFDYPNPEDDGYILIEGITFRIEAKKPFKGLRGCETEFDYRTYRVRKEGDSDDTSLIDLINKLTLEELNAKCEESTTRKFRKIYNRSDSMYDPDNDFKETFSSFFEELLK